MTGHTFGRRGKSLRLAFGAAVAIVALCDARAARAEDEPKVWQQLFFPFPIVGAPPQLEQQVQQERQHSNNQGGVIIVLGVGCIITLVFGTMIGSKTRRASHDE